MEPKLFLSLSGEIIDTKEKWEKYRREELRYLLEHYAYGHRPKEIPDKLSFDIAEQKLLGAIKYKRININTDGFIFPVRLYLPVSDKPVPCFVYFMHHAQELDSDIDNTTNNLYVPIDEICARGYAVAVIYSTDIYADDKNLHTYDEGIFTVYGPAKDKRRESDWAAISAWAFCASRVADYLYTDPDIESKELAVCGHSRSGKAALWTGATDERFSLVISNSSGCMGAAMLRGKSGEHIDFISTHTDWLCKKHSGYAENEEMLPIDQHMLLSLIAPRLLYVQSSSLDSWADPSAERRSCRLASRVYEMYGMIGAAIPDEEKIECNKCYHDGMIGYHMREGEHSIRREDWKFFLDFWDKKRLK